MEMIQLQCREYNNYTNTYYRDPIGLIILKCKLYYSLTNDTLDN